MGLAAHESGQMNDAGLDVIPHNSLIKIGLI
jgi:hypothetical protein